MGVVRDLSNLLVELLEKYEEPDYTDVCKLLTDTCIKWKRGSQAESLITFTKNDPNSLHFYWAEPEMIDGQIVAKHCCRSVPILGNGIALPANWAIFMDKHFKRTS